MIAIHREADYADILRSYTVVLDGEVVGIIKRGQTLQLPSVAHGRHSIWVKIDWCRSNKLDFDCAGEKRVFRCGSNMSGWRLPLLFSYRSWPWMWCWMREEAADQQ